MNRRDIPNAISFFRIFLVLPIVFLLLNKSFNLALVFFIVAGLSDALDGYLAKKYNWTSRLGSFIDPLADKLLLLSSFMVGVMVGLIPFWLLGIILMRDFIVGLGALLYHLWIEKFQGEPPFSSKLNTTLQVGYWVVLISAQNLLTIPLSWLEFLMYSVAATTTVSGLEYVWIWGVKAWSIAREKDRERVK